MKYIHVKVQVFISNLVQTIDIFRSPFFLQLSSIIIFVHVYSWLWTTVVRSWNLDMQIYRSLNSSSGSGCSWSMAVFICSFIEQFLWTNEQRNASNFSVHSQLCTRESKNSPKTTTTQYQFPHFFETGLHFNLWLTLKITLMKHSFISQSSLHKLDKVKSKCCLKNIKNHAKDFTIYTFCGLLFYAFKILIVNM